MDLVMDVIHDPWMEERLLDSNGSMQKWKSDFWTAMNNPCKEKKTVRQLIYLVQLYRRDSLLKI